MMSAPANSRTVSNPRDQRAVFKDKKKFNIVFIVFINVNVIIKNRIINKVRMFERSNVQAFKKLNI